MARGSANAPKIGSVMRGKNDLQTPSAKQNAPAPKALKGTKLRGGSPK